MSIATRISSVVTTLSPDLDTVHWVGYSALVIKNRHMHEYGICDVLLQAVFLSFLPIHSMKLMKHLPYNDYNSWQLIFNLFTVPVLPFN
jgi:hypothetical protein